MGAPKKNHSLAATADIHRLYELSVQNAEAEIDFVDKTFRRLSKRKPQLIREDFCGTANVCCEWVQRRKHNYAIGVDLDESVLEWSRQHRIGSLPRKQRDKIELVRADVLKVKTRPVDIVLAMNFSYWLLKTPNLLGKYFRSVCRSLCDDGIFFLDAYGGYDAFREIEEAREVEGDEFNFTYTWEQEKFDPITNDLTCSIHFEFQDGSSLPAAFHYEWRLWTLPEIRELLLSSGFSRVTFYWQGFDDDGDGDGDFRPVSAGEVDADAGWICYITAEK